MSSDDEHNAPELMVYRLGQVEGKIDALSEKLDKSVATREYVDEKISPIVNRVESLEEDKTWISRTVIGFVVLAVLALVVVSKGAS
jgi:hypothetical protein